jgi:cytochrome c-type biogenesis protein CcmE
VVVEGRYETPGLRAKQIMTSCPSKYEAQQEKETGTPQPGA